MWTHNYILHLVEFTLHYEKSAPAARFSLKKDIVKPLHHNSATYIIQQAFAARQGENKIFYYFFFQLGMGWGVAFSGLPLGLRHVEYVTGRAVHEALLHEHTAGVSYIQRFAAWLTPIGTRCAFKNRKRETNSCKHDCLSFSVFSIRWIAIILK